jgi:hypothetical protein
MSKSFLMQLIRHKYDLISLEYVGSSLLSYLSPFYRQFDLWVRYRGESISRQDHLNLYKWLSCELAYPIFALFIKIHAQISDFGNFGYFRSGGAR